mmetsp:Transcript_136/g.157  ORF Transcript_136/g.157 Transcript_136/m.157 type:complete len:93 (+) Transcript_136:804-1082(+)
MTARTQQQQQQQQHIPYFNTLRNCFKWKLWIQDWLRIFLSIPMEMPFSNIMPPLLIKSKSTCVKYWNEICRSNIKIKITERERERRGRDAYQ